MRQDLEIKKFSFFSKTNSSFHNCFELVLHLMLKLVETKYNKNTSISKKEKDNNMNNK